MTDHTAREVAAPDVLVLLDALRYFEPGATLEKATAIIGLLYGDGWWLVER